MRTSSRIISAIALFILPILVRYLWTNSFPFVYQPAVTTPNFEQATIPEPPTASAPISISESQEAIGQVVLIDYAHTNQFFVNEIEPFTRALTSRGAITEIHTGEEMLEKKLRYASAYVIMSPLSVFTPEEIRTVERFVANGGRLLVFTDPTRGMAFFDYTFPDVDSANLLLSSSGIAFSSDYLYNQSDNEGNFRNVKFSQFGEHPLTEELDMVVLYGTHSVLTGSGTVLLEASPKTLSSLTDQSGDLAGMVISANGNVLAAGDFTFMTTPFFSVADNAQLVERVAEFALGGERKTSLANFPYLFTGDVTLVALGETQLTSNLLTQVSFLQQSLRQNNVRLVLGDKKGATNNILIGVYEESEDIFAILKKYKIELDDSREFVTVPGIGAVGLAGTGVMFFETGANGNTLILLADSSANLEYMLAKFYEGELYGCVIQGNNGVCSLAYDDGTGTYEDEYYEDTYYEDQATPEPEQQPEFTPTPSG
ncbi:MAG: hypothetical protein CVU44_21890 [Chloroflexi bacterium HGW-Chloroflexi-6]|nr:MAG: hypothetical protein CVU44_21890 [Chloroflexi bacterium HGW-Chloroflexi-6]